MNAHQHVNNVTMSANDELTDSAQDNALTLAPGLKLLGASVRADERLSWYPEEDHGRYVPFNCYLLGSSERILVESGAPRHFSALAKQIGNALSPGEKIRRIAVTRNEPDSVANIPNWVGFLGLTMVHSPGLMNTLQYFRAEEPEMRELSFTHRSTELQMMNFGVKCDPSLVGKRIQVGESHILEVIAPPLRVLPSIWMYEETTRTLFCSDSFAEETSADRESRIAENLESHEQLVARFLRSFPLKFDWLRRADMTPIISAIDEIFAARPVEILAPTRGVVVRGAEAVKRKVSALKSALASLSG